MKKFIKATFAFAALALLLSSCNCFNKMMKKADRIQTSCVPEVLSLKGSQVNASYSVTFPAKYFDETTVLKITPVLVFETGEIAGAPKFVQGEYVRDNYTVIPRKTGATITEMVTFPYAPKMKQSTLELRIEAKCVNNCKRKDGTFLPFATIVVANGVSTVQEMADDFAKLSSFPDNFKRTGQISQDAKIMFLINKYNVREGQLDKQDIKALEDFIVANSGDAKKQVSDIYTKAYASPDGPLNFNDKLSQDRGKSTEAALSKRFSKDKMPANTRFDVEALGEDWEGFKELVEASDIPDKNLILQVLKMYDNPEKRDQEIKNMSTAFKVLAEKILPELRRSKLIVNVDVQGMTDAELKEAVKNNISKLNLEELLFAATLFNDPATKAMIYKTAAEKHNDARAWNNYGVVLADQGKFNDAANAFQKAAQLNSSSNEIINNLGVVALANGNLTEAKRFFSSINTPDAKYNLGLVNLAEGNYAEATKTLSGYNLAVAEVCNGNLAKAKTILANENSANAEYLKAVIAAREGNSNGVISNLKAAFAKDSSLKAVAAKDIEFAKWFGVTEFISIID